MLSNYCETVREKYGITIGQVQKLIPTLSNNIQKCVLHYRNLQLYLDLGLKLNKMLRSVHFGVVVVELINCKCGGIVRNEIW